MSLDYQNIRSRIGALSVPFIGFVVSAALAIATITGLAQFNATKTKVDAALVEGQRAASNYIVENLNDSALLESPISAQTKIVLIAARDEAINAMIDSLGEPVGKALIRANGGSGYDRADVEDIFDVAGTLIDLNGSRVTIQMAVRTKMHSAVPVDYEQETDTITASPSELALAQAQKSLSCPDSGDCGTCGICDSATGKCVANTNVPDGHGGNLQPGAQDASGKYNCLNYIDTLQGKYCQELGWNFINENGHDGCSDGADCKFIHNYNSWNIIGDPNTGTANVYWAGALIASGIPAFSTTVNVGGQIYNRGQAFPYGFNQDDPSQATYAVCEQSLPQRILFVTSNTYTGNLRGHALGLGLGSYTIDEGFLAADDICTMHANNAGLSGDYYTIISKSTQHQILGPGRQAFSVLSSGEYVELITPSNDILFSGQWAWNFNQGMQFPIENEFGVPISGSGDVWTATNFGGLTMSDLSIPANYYDCSGWTSANSCPPSPPGCIPSLCYLDCLRFRTDAYGKRGSTNSYSNYGWIQAAGDGFLDQCFHSRRLYCIQKL